MIRQHLDYIIALAEEKSITRAAERLGITQSALSQYLLGLEKSLQIPLFNRVRNDIAMTYAGEVYLAAARDIRKIQKNMISRIEDLSVSQKGELAFGVEMERGVAVLPRLFSLFGAAFPDVELHIRQGVRQSLEELAQMGHLDLVLLSVYGYETTLESMCIGQDEFLLTVPAQHPLAGLIDRSSDTGPGSRNTRYGPDHWPVIDPVLFRKAPFVVTIPNSVPRLAADALFEAADIQPSIVLESDTMTTAYDIAVSIGALCLVPESLIRYRDPLQRHAYFSIDRSRYSMKIVAAWRQDTYLSRAAKALIEMLRGILYL